MIRAVANGFVMKHFFNDVQSLHCKCNTFSAFRQRTILSSQWVSCVPLAQWIARWTSNPKVLGSTPRWDGTYWSVSVVVITSALHAEGRQFEPGTDQILAFQGFYFSVYI